MGHVWPLLIPLFLMNFDTNSHGLTWVVFIMKSHKTKTLNEILVFLDFYGGTIGSRHHLQTQTGGQHAFLC